MKIVRQPSDSRIATVAAWSEVLASSCTAATYMFDLSMNATRYNTSLDLDSFFNQAFTY